MAGSMKLNRRALMSFLLGGVVGGVALLSTTADAHRITTDDDGLLVGDVQVQVKDGFIPAYRAAPRRLKNPPVILVVHDFLGVQEQIRDVCRRFAKLGFLAVAPSLFTRQGDVSRAADAQEIRTRIVAKVPDAQVLADLDATRSWAVKEGRGDPERTAIVGFSWGGRIVWLYAAHAKELAAGVAFYGRLSGDKTQLTPRHPIDVASALRAPVMGLYGGGDTSVPLGTVSDMQQALKKANKPSMIRIYSSVGHAFFSDDRSSYRKQDALDAWAEVKAWLERHGLGRG